MKKINWSKFKKNVFLSLFIISGFFFFSYLLGNLNKYCFLGGVSKEVLDLKGEDDFTVLKTKNRETLEGKEYLKIKIPKDLYIIGHGKKNKNGVSDFVFLNTIYYSKDNLNFFSLLNSTIRHEIIHYYIGTTLKYYIDRQKNTILFLFYDKIGQNYFDKLYNELNCSNFYKDIDSINDYNLLLNYIIYLKKCKNFDKVRISNYKKYGIKDYFFKRKIYGNYELIKRSYRNLEMTEELITYSNYIFIKNDYRNKSLKKMNCLELEDKVDRKICNRMIKFYSQIFVLK